jgi:hypothetical protein
MGLRSCISMSKWNDSTWSRTLSPKPHIRARIGCCTTSRLSSVSPSPGTDQYHTCTFDHFRWWKLILVPLGMEEVQEAYFQVEDCPGNLCYVASVTWRDEAVGLRTYSEPELRFVRIADDPARLDPSDSKLSSNLFGRVLCLLHVFLTHTEPALDP